MDASSVAAPSPASVRSRYALKYALIGTRTLLLVAANLL